MIHKSVASTIEDTVYIRVDMTDVTVRGAFRVVYHSDVGTLEAVWDHQEVHSLRKLF